MAGELKFQLKTVSNGGAHFASKLDAMADNMDKIPEVAPLVFKALEEYHEAKWGAGEVVTAATVERWPSRSNLFLGEPSPSGTQVGALRDSLTKTMSEGAVRIVTPWGFVWGTDIPYARFLQYGTRKMARKPVLRPVIAVRSIMAKIVRDFLFREAL